MSQEEQRDERVAAAFAGDDSASGFDSRRGWTAFVARRTRQARRRVLAFAGTAIAIVVALVGAFTWRESRRAPEPAIAAVFDSLSVNPTPEEPAMNAIAQATQHEIPQGLMPLLGHRTALRHDIEEFQDKLQGLRQQLSAHPGDGQLKADIATVTEQLTSSQAAMRIIDRQLAALEAPPSTPELPSVPVPGMPAEFVSISADPPIIVNPAFEGEEYLVFGAGALIMLTWVAMTLYVRRTTRATITALSAIQTQHATLAAGIEAVAVEVERLGEGQRYMSKVLAGGESGGQEQRSGIEGRA